MVIKKFTPNKGYKPLAGFSVGPPSFAKRHKLTGARKESFILDKRTGMSTKQALQNLRGMKP